MENSPLPSVGAALKALAWAWWLVGLKTRLKLRVELRHQRMVGFVGLDGWIEQRREELPDVGMVWGTSGEFCIRMDSN